jgi:hypothetical protein
MTDVKAVAAVSAQVEAPTSAQVEAPTSAALLTISLLPDVPSRAPASRKSERLMILTGWARMMRKHTQ